MKKLLIRIGFALCGLSLMTSSAVTANAADNYATVLYPRFCGFKVPVYNNTLDMTFTHLVSQFPLNTILVDGQDVTSSFTPGTNNLTVADVTNPVVAISLLDANYGEAKKKGYSGYKLDPTGYKVYVNDNVLYISSSSAIADNTVIAMTNHANTLLFYSTYANCKEGIRAVDPGMYNVFVGATPSLTSLGSEVDMDNQGYQFVVYFPEGNKTDDQQ